MDGAASGNGLTPGPEVGGDGRGRSSRRMKYAVATVGVTLLCQSGALLPVLAKHLQQYLGIGDRGFGLLFSVGAIAGLATVLIGGALVDRWGPRRVIRIGLMGIAAAMLMIALAGPRWPLFAVAFGLSALFSGPLHLAVNAYLVRLFPRNKRRVLSLKLAAGSLGGAAFPCVSEGLLWLMQSLACVTFGMILHAPFAVVALAILGASFMYRGRAGFSADQGRTQPWRWRDMTLPRRVIPILVLMGLHGAAGSALFVWMARFLGSASFTSHPIRPGFVLSGCALAYFVARSALALVPERLGRRSFMIAPGILGGGVFIAGILTRSYILTAGGYVLGAGLWSLEYPAMLSVVAHEAPRRFGAAMAVQRVGMSALTFVALNATGFLAASVGEVDMWKAMLLPACAFPLIGVGAAVWVAVCGRRLAGGGGAAGRMGAA